MNILITGGNFYNKGAHLMLISLVKSINIYIPDSKIFVSPLLKQEEIFKELKISTINYPLLPYNHKRDFFLSLKFPFLAKLYLKLKGFDSSGDIPLNKVDLVMDISGYAFGDKWGNRPLHHLNLFAQKIKKMGGKFFMMPQAFGPFSNSNMKKDINALTNNVELLIARDIQSYNYIQDALYEKSEKLMCYPDITLVYKHHIDVEGETFGKEFCLIVPNDMMLQKASDNWQKEYLIVLKNIIDIILKDSNLNIVILIHSLGTSGDADIGRSIVNDYEYNSERVKYYEEEDPVRSKAIIAKSKFLVGSRFHALASALSSNVPSIATSWLHKYEMLFNEYNCGEFNFKEPNVDIYNKIKELLDPNTRKEIEGRLKSVNENVRKRNKEMWDLILSKINE